MFAISLKSSLRGLAVAAPLAVAQNARAQAVGLELSLRLIPTAENADSR